MSSEAFHCLFRINFGDSNTTEQKTYTFREGGARENVIFQMLSYFHNLLDSFNNIQSSRVLCIKNVLYLSFI